jgi:N-acetylglucosamine kinase
MEPDVRVETPHAATPANGIDVVIGVDGGGTKTVVVLADDSGSELARATGQGTNLQTVGATVVAERIAGLFALVARQFGHPITVRAVTVSLAGVDRPADVPVATRAITSAMAAVAVAEPGLTWALVTSRPSVTNDAVAALAAGARALDGVVVIAGTGSIAFGIRAGERARAGGWGSILGDEGSGYSLGYDALRAVARAHDRRAPATGLTRAILAHLGAATPPDLIGIVSAPEWGVAQTASLAPLVVHAAEEGDAVACALVDDAAAELATATLAVIGALAFDPAVPIPVVQAGGLWPASPLLRKGFATRLKTGAPFALPSVSAEEPVRGAVWMAMHDAGFVPGGQS